MIESQTRMLRENAFECCAGGPRTLSTRFHDESRVNGLLDSIHCGERERDRTQKLLVRVDGL